MCAEDKPNLQNQKHQHDQNLKAGTCSDTRGPVHREMLVQLHSKWSTPGPSLAPSQNTPRQRSPGQLLLPNAHSFPQTPEPETCYLLSWSATQSCSTPQRSMPNARSQRGPSRDPTSVGNISSTHSLNGDLPQQTENLSTPIHQCCALCSVRVPGATPSTAQARLPVSVDLTHTGTTATNHACIPAL